ncbi:MAG: PaaI family thioesterase [Acetobacteraceae bacterium]|nr:PaaI family thioesterase [Acetobacteraceae bacterium]
MTTVRLKGQLPGFARLMGVQLTVTELDRVAATLAVREELTNGGGAIHGGALMAFADTLGAVATMINLPDGAQTTTMESKTNFIAPAATGTVLTGEATPIHKGRTTMIWQTRITRPDGRLVALVTQTQLVMPAAAKTA